MSGPIHRLTRSGHIAYLSNSNAGLHVIDVSDPENPVNLTTIDILDGGWDFQLDSRLEYAAAG